MQLSQHIGLGLKRLGNPSLISEECYKTLVEVAPEVILRTHTANELDFNNLGTSKVDIVKESFAALLVLLVESARHDLDGNVLSATLENYAFSSDRINLIAEVLCSKRTEFKRMLLQIKSHLPNIVNVNWRLDFCLRSSGSYHPSSPVFFIQLVSEACSNNLCGGIVVKKYSFLCSLLELEELVNKLREATRHIETIGNVK